MAEVNVKRVKSSEIEFKDRLVAINRVTKVTKGGRTFTFAAIVVIGNENGVVGYGLGKAKLFDDFARFRGTDYRRAQWKQVYPCVCHREHGWTQVG